ncbi:MAG: DMT family transporter, partial [Methanobacteriota archaeon]
LHPGDIRLILAAGVLLALHFATWIGSLKFTSVAHSLTLESTHPVIAILLSPLLLKERAEKRSRIAVVFTLLGIIIVAGVDLEFRTRQLWGDLLALSSALFVTLYLFVARHLRERIDLVTYLLYVYGAAMVVLLVFNFFIDASLYRYSWKVHFLLVLLALIPTGVGHSLLNWAARRVKAYKVNLTILGEPVLASILAFLFFREMPGKWFFVGAILILTGIGLAIFETSEVEQSSPEEIVDSGETNTH